MAPLVLLTGSTGFIGSRVLLDTLRSGYNVRITARSPEKAQTVLSNPVIQALAPGERLTSVIIPDVTAAGAFDEALQDVNYVMHVGSPVPVPGYDPIADVYRPTVEGTANLLSSAQRYPSIRRIVITSSIAGNLPLIPDANVLVTASSRVSPPAPDTASNVFEAYIFAKMAEIHNTDQFVDTQNPHFSVAHIIPGYVFGRNELLLGNTDTQAPKSSNGILIASITGHQVPNPVHEGFVHISDLSDLHLKVMEYTGQTPRAFGACNPCDHSATYDYVAKAYPKAVAEGVFTRGFIPTLPAPYDSSETEKVLGFKFRSFEEAVLDAAGQFLETIGKERA